MPLFRISSGGLQTIPERSYRDVEVSANGEVTLQRYLEGYPEIIPGEAIDPDDPPRFVVIQSEAGVTPGSLDILLLDHNAIPTVIEAKLVDNREIRRSVVAQGIEYLAFLQTEWSAERFAEAGRAYWTSKGKSFEEEAFVRLRSPLLCD